MKIVDRKILLNPGPATTSDDVKMAMVVPDICPRETEFCLIMNSIKNDLPLVVNGDSDYVSVLFASSGTGALESVITSSIPKKRKLLVIENGAYGTRIRKIAERYSITVLSYILPYGDYPNINEVKRLMDSDKEISHIAVVDHETTSGMRNPVQAICDLAHMRNIEVIVDCISSFAGLPINLKSWHAEYIISSSNKCIQGMAGISFVIFKRDLLNKLEGNARSYYFDLYSQYIGFHNNGQMQFTPPVQVIYALRKALDLLFLETVENRIIRYKNNYMILYSGLKKLGFKFLLPDDQQSGILIAVKEPDNPEYNFNHMHDYLYEKGFTIYPGKGAKENTFRLSIIGDLFSKDIQSFIFELTGYLKSIGIQKIIYNS